LLEKGEPAQVEIYRGGKVQTKSHPLPEARWSRSYKREAEAFVRAVLEGTPVRSSGQDTLQDVRLFEDIYRIYLQQRGVLS
jgi:predicted dehydrogenase